MIPWPKLSEMAHWFDRKVTIPIYLFCAKNCAGKRGYILINLIGVVYTWSTILLLLYFGSQACQPLEGADQCTTYVAVGVFIVAESLLNFLCFHIFAYRNRLDYITPPPDFSKSSPIDPMRNDLIDSKTMKFCSLCNRTVPVRSHHCSLCQYCVLKNDHHCFALGGCVGYGNQRFFVVFAFWAMCGGFYGGWMCSRFVHAYIIPFGWFGIFDYFFPMALIKWLIFQHIEFTKMGYIMLVTAGFCGACGALLFFIMQWVLIFKDKTLHEFTKGKKSSACDGSTPPLWMRIEYVFGPYWYVNFIVPLPFRNRMDESMNRFLYEYQLKKV